jgi:hypothetical protein
LAVLQTLGVVINVDISAIECSHAAVRRLLRAGAQTHRRTLEQVSADFLLMKQRVLEAGILPQEGRGRSPKPGRQKRKYNGGAGPQRAHFSKQLRKFKGTDKLTRDNRKRTFSELNAEVRGVLAEDGPAKKRLVEMGSLGREDFTAIEVLQYVAELGL